MLRLYNSYQSTHLKSVTAHLERKRIVSEADAVLVVGGGEGTKIEVLLARQYERVVIAIPQSGGYSTQLAKHGVIQGHQKITAKLSEGAALLASASSDRDLQLALSDLLKELRNESQQSHTVATNSG